MVQKLGSFKELSEDVKLGFLDTDAQKKFKAINEELSRQAKNTEAITKKEKELAQARKTMDKQASTLDRAKEGVGKIRDDKTRLLTKLTNAKENKALATSNGDAKGIAKYTAEIQNLNTELTILARKQKEAEAEVTAADEAYKTSKEAVTGLEKEFNRMATGSLTELKQAASAAGVSLEGLKGKTPEEQVKILTQRFGDLKTELLSGAEPAFEAFVGNCKEGAEAARLLAEQVEEAGDEVKRADEIASSKEAFANKIKQFLGLQGAAELMKKALRDAIATITELDATMTEMAVVTDLSVGDYWAQLPEYSKQASDLGVSINSAYKAATLYYQQGLKGNEVTKISAETLKMAKIAGLDAAEATNKMTAALRGFNMELNETSAQRVSDVYSKLAAITAADTKEIANAMTKTASIASSAGMEFETTAAFLSQIIETTRESAETAGTAMKTVIARFQELKKDPSEIGEVEGEIVDANKIETALRSVGVSLRDAKGQFRELDEVFLELSSKWDGLDKNTQRYIATIAAGSRQQSRFIAMMSNYKRTQDLVSAANNSAGASNKQFAKTMDSLESKLEKLKNAWHEFSMGILQSDFVKVGVDILTKFLEVINKSTNSLGKLGNSVSKIVGIFTVFKMGSLIFEKLKQPLIDFFAEIVQRAEETGRKAGEAAKKGLEQSKDKQSSEKQSVEDTVEKSSFYAKLFGAESEELRKYEKERREYAKDARSWKKMMKQINKASEKNNKEAEGLIKNSKPFAENEAKQRILTDWYKQAADQQKVAAEKAASYVIDNTEYWKAWQSTIKQTGKTITSTGVAVSLFGGILASLGLEEAGNNMAKFGQYVTMLGAATSTVGPLVVGMLGKITAAIGSVYAALGIVGLILAAIAAAIVGLMAGLEWVKENTRSGQLEKAKKIANEAAEAADKAAEAYQDISNSISSLDDKYKALDDLRQGTEEWKEEVQKLNAEVLDLITKYPEFAAFMKNTGGVLSLDTKDEGVQKIIDNYNRKQLQTSLYQTYSQFAVISNQKEVAFGSLSDGAKIDNSEMPIGADNNGLNKEQQTNAIAEALYRGLITLNKKGDAFNIAGSDQEQSEKELEKLGLDPDVIDNINAFDSSVYDSVKELTAYGKTLANLDQESENYSKALVAQAQLLMDTTDKTEQQQNWMSNLVTDEVINQNKTDLESKYYKTNIFGNWVTKKGPDTDKAIEEFLLANGATTVTKTGNKNIKYVQDGQTITKDREAVVSQMVAQASANEAVKILETVDDAVEDIIKSQDSSLEGPIKAALEDIGGSKIVDSKQLDALRNINEDRLRMAYDESDELQGLFGSADDLVGYFNTVIQNAAAVFGNIKFKKSYMSEELNLRYDSKLKAAEDDPMTDFSGYAVGGALDVLLSKTKQSKYSNEAVIERLLETDFFDETSLKNLRFDLVDTFGYSKEAAEAFVRVLRTQADVTFSASKELEVFGKTFAATTAYEDDLKKREQLQWDYERLQNNNADPNTLANNRARQKALLSSSISNAQLAYESGWDDIAAKYDSDNKLKGYVKFDRETKQLDVTGLQEYISLLRENGKTEEADAAEEYANTLLELADTADNHLDVAKDCYVELEQMKKEEEEAYREISELIGDALIAALEKQIEQQEEMVEATNEMADKMLNKLQEQIEEERVARELDEAKQDITSLYSQRALLASQGGSQLARQQLDKQIQESEQNYYDSILDNALNDIQRQNERAEEQRQEQIQIAQKQLELYRSSEALQRDIDAVMVNYKNEYVNTVREGRIFRAADGILGTLLAQGYTDGMNEWDTTQLWKSLEGNTALLNAMGGTTQLDANGNLTVTLADGTTLTTTLPEGTTVTTSEGTVITPAQGFTANIPDNATFTLPDGTEFTPNVIISELTDSNGLIKVDASGATYQLNGGTIAVTLDPSTLTIPEKSFTLASDETINLTVPDTATVKLSLKEDVLDEAVGIETKGITFILDKNQKVSFKSTSNQLDATLHAGEIKAGLYPETLTAELQPSEMSATLNPLVINGYVSTDTVNADMTTTGEKITASLVSEGTINATMTTKEAIAASIDPKGAINATLKVDKIEAKLVTDETTQFTLVGNPFEKANAQLGLTAEALQNVADTLATADIGKAIAILAKEKVTDNANDAGLGDAITVPDELPGINEAQDKLDKVEQFKADYDTLGNNELNEYHAAISNAGGNWISSKDYYADADLIEAIYNFYQNGGPMPKSWNQWIIDEEERAFTEVAGAKKGTLPSDAEIDTNFFGSNILKFNGNKAVVEPVTQDQNTNLNATWKRLGGDESVYTNRVIEYQGVFYVSIGNNGWYSVNTRKKDGGNFAGNVQYKTGGLADFTGPAWLDGTPSKPEYILNASQTESFLHLVDILDAANPPVNAAPWGDNYFDINISVEKIEDDYDVEQMANKIRRMIYEDATYRNVNTINKIR